MQSVDHYNTRQISTCLCLHWSLLGSCSQQWVILYFRAHTPLLDGACLTTNYQLTWYSHYFNLGMDCIGKPESNSSSIVASVSNAAGAPLQIVA
jgi:hypothetical protein